MKKCITFMLITLMLFSCVSPGLLLRYKTNENNYKCSLKLKVNVPNFIFFKINEDIDFILKQKLDKKGKVVSVTFNAVKLKTKKNNKFSRLIKNNFNNSSFSFITDEMFKNKVKETGDNPYVSLLKPFINLLFPSVAEEKVEPNNTYDEAFVSDINFMNYHYLANIKNTNELEKISDNNLCYYDSKISADLLDKRKNKAGSLIGDRKFVFDKKTGCIKDSELKIKGGFKLVIKQGLFSISANVKLNIDLSIKKM